VVAAFVVFLLVLVGFIGYGWWDSQMGPPHSKALQVGDTSFNLDFFSRRTKGFLQDVGLANPGQQVDPNQLGTVVSVVAGILEQEVILRQRAPVDLEITATPEEVQSQIAGRLTVSPDDPVAFQAAYDADLKKRDLSDKEYRDMIEAEVLSTKVSDGFVRAAPEVADQVRIRQIQVGAKEDADKALERLNAGEDFAVVAKDMSSDTTTKDQGGEKGWVTLEQLDSSYAAKVFALDVGQRSEALEVQGGFLIVEVEEKQAGRSLDSDQRDAVGGRYFSLWLNEQRALLRTTNYVSFDADKLQWVVDHAI